MKQRHISATPTIAALALTALLILTTLPLAGTAAPRLEQQPLESLTALNSTEATERGVPLSAFSVPSAASVTTTDAQNVELVGQIGGMSRAVAVQGDYAYLGLGPTLSILDVSNPITPRRVGYTILPEFAQGIYVSGSYAYVADMYAGLRVVNVSNPSNPVEVGSYDTPGHARDVYVSGPYAYVADGWRGLRVVDVSDPTSPVEVGSDYTPREARGIYVSGSYAYVADSRYGLRVIDASDPADPTEVGSCYTPGGAWGVYVSGSYAYVAAYQYGLRVLDVSDPASPVEVGSYDTPWDAEGVYVSGSYAYVADDRGLRVVNVSDPANPVEVGSCDTTGAAYSIYVSGSYAYIADEYSGLRVVDVSDPAGPIEVGAYDTPGQVKGVYVSGAYAYVADGDRGLRVVDVSDPTNPVEVGYGYTPGDAKGVYVSGFYAYVADGDRGLRVMDVSDPADPVEVGAYDTLGNAGGVYVSGSYAYVADGGRGLRVVDVSDPANLIEVSAYDTPGQAERVYVSETYAYVADGDRGLRVVDVSDPADPVETGFYDTPGWIQGIYVVGDYAYMADEYRGLRLLNVSDPAGPVEMGSYDTPGWAYSVYVSGSYAYVADDDRGLRVIDVSDPTDPVEVGSYDTPGWAQGVYIVGSYAYVADKSGLRVVDVSDPSGPVEAGAYDTPGRAQGVYVVGSYAYVADMNLGLRVVDVSNLADPVGVGACDTLRVTWEIYVSGSYAYVVDDDRGLRVIDVSDPTDPVEVGSYDTPGHARGIYVSGFYAYVGDGWDGGLRVVDVSDPTRPVEIGACDTPGYGLHVSGSYAYMADGYGLRVVDVSDPTHPVEVGACSAPGYAHDVFVSGRYAYVVGHDSGLRVIDVLDPTSPTEVGAYDTPENAERVYVSGSYAYVAGGDSGLRVVDVSDPGNPVEVGFYDTLGMACGVYVLSSHVYVADVYGGLIILRYTGGPETTYSISGRVTDAGGDPVSDVTLSDGAGHTATTDSNGNYTISDLSAGTYTLTPSKSGYTFSPASRTVSVPPSATEQDFTEAPGPPPPLDKPPVVLVHGWAGASGEGFRCEQGIWRVNPEVPNTFGTFGEMAKWLDEDGGFDVWIAHLDTGPDGTPRLEANAWGPRCLKDQIAYVKQVTGAHQVILIAHSMGGLVSRAYIEGPEYETDVQALFTLGSPHAGIPIDSIIDGLPDWSESYCGGDDDQDDGQEAVCQMSEVSMYIWNRVYGSISHGVTPPYYLIGGDKSDSVPGRILKSCGVDPNDGYIGTRSAQALKDGSTAIQSNVKARYQTHETHSSSWVLGRPSYFQPPSGQVHSQSYQCIENVLMGTSNPCAGPSSAALSAQAAPSLTGHTSDARGHLNTGETTEHNLQVDTDSASLFYLSWITGTLGFTLTNPVGTVIDPAYAAANTDVVTYTISSGSEMMPSFASYAFTTTVPGLYTATITAGDVGITGTDYLLFAAMETTRTLSVALDSNHYQIGDTAALTATLEGAGDGITGATVQATFSRSDSITDTLTLTDQGDGTYRGTYAIPNAPGYLHLLVTAEGSDAGTEFNRQVDRLLTVASQAVQLTGTYADRADDADGNGRYETLTVDVEVLAAGAGDFTFSADLVNGGDQFVAHVITQTALITGTQSVPLRFDGDLIHDGGSDGPFTVTNLLISDPQNAGIPSVMADDVWTTAAYDHTQFGRITGDMNGDCIVTVVDIMLVASRWGTNIGDIRYDGLYDLDNSGNIDIEDIMIVAIHWRETCE